ncbi:MAG: hypothetical protein H7Y42_18435 [Chitinophagaceae bacterium]|nr:hypothetical protein [Chitinophagaceae bacterium]
MVFKIKFLAALTFLVSAMPREVETAFAGPAVPSKRAHHELIYDEANKRVLLTGGSTPLDGGKSFEFFNDVWSFDGENWAQSGFSGDKRSGFRMAYSTKSKKFYSFGGFSNNTSLADLRVLESGEWKTMSDDVNMRAAEPGFVYDSHRDRLVAFGGSGARGVVNDITWEWDGAAWKKWEGSGPTGRQAFAMIYDSKRKKVVLFGGMGLTPDQTDSDTWEFDGAQWIKVTSEGPSPRISPGACYDSKRGMMIVFGGMTKNGFVGDTWGWDGKLWKKLADSGPAPRVMGYMAYDKHRDKVVLFGGRLGWPNDANDTWEWDGRQWKEIK